jgi:hypothetical protein
VKFWWQQNKTKTLSKIMNNLWKKHLVKGELKETRERAVEARDAAGQLNTNDLPCVTTPVGDHTRFRSRRVQSHLVAVTPVGGSRSSLANHFSSGQPNHFSLSVSSQFQ